ncbi:MAG: heavy metal-binding domain-containing protein [bacterium]|nr:heavy metal-binding domain-containing protein [bacterium]
MISTTTNEIPGKEVVEILDIVRGFSMKGFATILSSFTDPMRLRSMNEEVLEIEHEAYADMVKHAEKVGADAIIGVRLSPSSFENDNALKYQATVYGTAVKIRDK